MIHLKPGSDYQADVSAVMLADGKWYKTFDPTLPGDGDREYLSFLQYPNGREHGAVMVNVNLADIKAAAYFGVPTPEPGSESCRDGETPERPALRMIIARTVEAARTLAESLHGPVSHQTVFASPRSIKAGAGRGLILDHILVDESVWPLDGEVLDVLVPATLSPPASWWIRRSTDGGKRAEWVRAEVAQ